MSIEVLVPNLPESVADATLITWHKQVGDSVNKNDNLVDLETDKVVLEVTAPESGILTQILKDNGTVVTSGELLAVLAAAGTAVAASTPAEVAAENTADMPLSPSVRRLISENTLNPAEITGTGKSGRLTKTDVLDHLSKQAPAAEAAAVVTPSKEAVPEAIAPIAIATSTVAAAASNLRPEQRVPMTRLRAKVAERLLQAQQNAAMLTTFNEVNMQNVMDLRNQYKTRFEQKHAVKLGFMSFFC